VRTYAQTATPGNHHSHGLGCCHLWCGAGSADSVGKRSRGIIKEALETRWEVLVQGDITLLDELYSTQAQRAKHIEQLKLLKHRILPTWTRGYRYFEYTSEIEIESLQVARGSITATVKERVNLVWGQFRPFANTAGVSGVHNLHLVWERGQWRVAVDQYPDQYNYLHSLEHPEDLLPDLLEQFERYRGDFYKKR